MKIADIRLTGLAGATVEGGWAEELVPQDNLHTVVEVIAEDGRIGIGSAMTSLTLVEGGVKLLRPFLIGERADEPARVSEKLRQNTFWQGRGGAVEHAISGIDIALWDLFGKITNQPVGRLLGGMYRDKIKPYGSLLFDEPEPLREKLKNNEITVVTRMEENGNKKMIYTSKEKFEHLAEKNPYLNELKDRLGLDWDF